MKVEGTDPTRRKGGRLPAAILAALLAAGGVLKAAPPAGVDPAYLGLLEWRLVGPFRGGRSVAVAGDPIHPLVAYAGAVGGGVWKTADGGRSWRNVSDGFFETASVGALAVAPSDPNVIYAGMGESCFRGNAQSGDGVYRSSDGGKSWSHRGLAATRQIARIRVHPRDPDTVYVAAFGDGFGPSPERGVFRSRDGGRSWQKVLFRGDDAGAIDLAMDPADPSLLYASLLEFRRFPWGLRSAGPGTGLFKTTDGGDSWTEITRSPGLPAGTLGRIGVALSPARPERVFALVDAETGRKGLFRSDDGGRSFARVSDFAQLTVRPWYFHHVFADPRDPDTVYVLNIQMWKSSDGGRTFSEIRPPHGDHHDLWIDPADPKRLVEANDGGGTISYDGGRSWSEQLNQPTAQLYHVAVDDQFPYRIYGAQQDNTTLSLPSRSDFGSIGAAEWINVGGGEAGAIAVDPRDPNVIVAGEHHFLERYDLRTRQTQDISPWPESNWGWGDRDLKFRFQWTYPVLRSRHDPATLYVGSQFVHRSDDEGRSWRLVSPDLSRHDPSRLEPMPSWGDEKPGPYWGPITRDNTGVEWYSTVFALAESPLTPGLLWAGSDDGLVHVSPDAGATWTNVTPSELPEFALVSIIEASPHDAAVAYLAATRYKLQDRRPYLFKTRDSGSSWTRITAGIPDDDFTRVIREDPGRRGLLYAGTETGVYVSFDDGAAWQPLRLNLPVVPVHDLAVHRGDLIAATHGRSFWILDEASLLRQLDAAATADEFHLFAPRPAVRFQQNAAPAARDDADSAGKNPPNGVVVRWYAKTRPAGPVTLRFEDAAGQPIRSFSSDDPPPADARRPGAARAAVSAEAGPHRFVWDMRYPPADVVPGTILRGRPTPPLATPGRYRVRLEVGGRTLVQPFEIVKDPRVAASDAELQEQLGFLLAVRDALGRTHGAVRRIRGMRERAEQAIAGTTDKELRARLTPALVALNAKLFPIEERLSQFRAKDVQDLTNYGNGLDDKLANLLGLQARSDAAPTRPARELFQDLERRLAGYLAALDGVARTEWEPFAKAGVKQP